MKTRCNNPNTPAYARYGGRGIKVCEPWQSFQGFYADMGDPPSKNYSLDRIDNDGNYEPGNVRWATRKEQGEKTNRTVQISYRGETKNLSDWARQLGIPYQTLQSRVCARHWPIQKAFTP